MLDIDDESSHVFEEEISDDTNRFLKNNKKQAKMSTLHQMQMSQMMSILLVKGCKLQFS